MKFVWMFVKGPIGMKTLKAFVGGMWIMKCVGFCQEVKRDGQLVGFF